MADLVITQVRSQIGSKQNQRRTLRALGLRKIRHSVTQPDRPEIRGMIAKVAHLVEVRVGDDVVELESGQEPTAPPAGGSQGGSRPPSEAASDEETS